LSLFEYATHVTCHLRMFTNVRPARTQPKGRLDSLRLVNDPTRLVANPTRLVNDPTRLVHDPTWLVNDPTRLTNDPTWLVNNPTRLEANPTRLVEYQSRLVADWAGILGASHVCD